MSTDQHRRTRQGFGEEAASPNLKNFLANSVFRASATCSKTLNDEKYMFNTVKIFRASASCSKILNGKNIHSIQ